MALLRSSYAPALPALAHVAGRAVVRGAAAALAAAVVLVCSPPLVLLALLCAPPLLAALLVRQAARTHRRLPTLTRPRDRPAQRKTVQLFSDLIVWLLKRVPLYRTAAARLHARTFERLEPRLVEARCRCCHALLLRLVICSG